jgi:hypothetical protein
VCCFERGLFNEVKHTILVSAHATQHKSLRSRDVLVVFGDWALHKLRFSFSLNSLLVVADMQELAHEFSSRIAQCFEVVT